MARAKTKKGKGGKATTARTGARAAAKRPRLARARARNQAARPTTVAKQAAFCEAYGRLGVITDAAREAGIDRGQHYDWLADPDKYPRYKSQFEAAYEKACDVLEAEARRRGVEGWDEPVYGSGGRGKGTRKVGTVRRHSDRLLELLLRAKRPEQFRDRGSVDLTSAGQRLAAGVLVVPGVAAGEDWTKKAAEQQRALEEHARSIGESSAE